MVRTLYCILTRGGVLKSLFPDSADAGMLISLFSAVIHDYEHKGVNVRGRVFRLGRPYMIYRMLPLGNGEGGLRPGLLPFPQFRVPS